MRNCIGNWLFLLIALLPGLTTRSQCTVKVFSDPTENYCGYPFFPSAIGDAKQYVTVAENNFNSKTLGAGWNTSSNITFNNPCGSGDGTPYMWMGSGTSSDRNISTIGFDVSTGGKVCFDLRFADQNGTNVAPPGCEAPDLPWEGVYFQYSIDNGTTWKDIYYFDPTPFPNTLYTAWNKHCFTLPEDAKTTSTRFRWQQLEISGPEVDHWGLDNIEILANDPNFEYIWDHTTSKLAHPGAHVPTTSPFTYHVTYRNKNTGQSCQSSIVVTTIQPSVWVIPDSITSCAETPVQLNCGWQFLPPPSFSCGIDPKGCKGSAKSTTVGSATVTSNIVFNNSGAGSNKTQFIYKPTELEGGQLNGQLANISLNAAPTGISTLTYLNFSVKIGCTATTAFTGDNFETGLTTVYSSASYNFKTGWNIIDFQDYYYYNGTSNLVIEICWSNISTKNDLPLRGQDLSWFASSFISGNTNSTSNCGKTTGGTASKFRPQVILGYCARNLTGITQIRWTPNTGFITSDTIQSPRTAPPSNTTYTVTITDAEHPHCIATGKIEVKVKNTGPGKDSSVTFCKQTGSVNLFNLLAGSPQAGGNWKDPNGLSHSGTINPATAISGAYSYSINDPDCGNFSSKVVVTIESPPNPGISADSSVCKTTTAVNLLGVLKGSPANNGTWTDVNNSGALNNGVFNPSQVNVGTYSFIYTVPATAACPKQQATVKITVISPSNAGGNTSITVCNSGGSINLLIQLSGTPQSTGTWTNNNGAGSISGHTLNMSGMINGTYTYTYTIPASNYCPAASAILTIKLVASPNPGTNGTIVICNTAASLNLINVLTGQPDPGGVWTDVNGSGQMSPSGILNVANTNPGTYKFNYTLNAEGCPTGQATATVTVNKQNYAGTGRDTSICSTGTLNLFGLLTGYSSGGTWVDMSSTGRLNGANFNMVGLAPGSYQFSYNTVSAAPCANQTTKIMVSTEKPADAGNGSSLVICTGDSVALFSLLTGTPGVNGTWYGIPALTGLNSSTGKLKTNNSTPGNYLVRYVVVGKAPCLNDTATFNINITNRPKLANPQYFCVNQNKQYYVELDIIGGIPGTYTVTPSGTITGGSSPKFKSALINSKTGQTFYIIDANNCKPDSIKIYYDCGCVTQPGATQLDTLKVCENMLAKAVYDNGFVSDGNDTLVFVLHEGSADSLINPHLYKKTPEFTYNPVLSYGKVYYISAVAANKGIFHGLDQQDSCYTVAPGTPVIFNALPQVTYSTNSPVCQGDSAIINLRFTKGSKPFKLFYSFQAVPGSKTFNDTIGQLAFQVFSDANFTLTNLTSQGCSTPLNQQSIIQVDDSLVISDLNFQCNPDNNKFSITFSIVNGNVAQYAVSGIAGTLSNNVFNSALINSPSAYSFSVTDGSSCPPVIISGNYTCPCITNPGTFTSTALIKVCGNNPAVAAFANDQKLDKNDKHYFILHNSPTSVGIIYDTATTPEFSYRAGLVYGQRYYISSVAGDSTAAFLDTNSSCFGLSNSVPVIFYPNVSGSISGTSNVCESIGLTITPTLTGFGPFSLVFTDQNSTTYSFKNISSGQAITFNPPPGNFQLVFTSMLDETSGCAGTVSGTYLVNIIPSPRAAVTGDTAICANSGAVTLRLSLTGQPPFSASISENNTVINSYTGLSNTFSFTVSPPAGEYTYKVLNIKDNDPAQCPGIMTDSALVLVRPLPNISITGSGTFCKGSGTYLHFSAGNLYPGYQSNYDLTILHQPGNETITFQMKGNIDSLLVIPTVGNNTYQIVNCIDAKSNCNGTGSGIATLSGVDIAISTLSGDSVLCNSPTNKAVLSFTHTGAGNITTYYSDSRDNHYQFTGAQQAAAYLVTHLVDTGFTRFFIDSVVDGSGVNCPGIHSGDAKITVNSLPTASLTINGSKFIELCLDDSALIEISATGKLPITVRIEDQLSQPIIRSLNSLKDSFWVHPYATPTPSNEYSLISVNDANAPSCYNYASDSVIAEVKQRPFVQVTTANPIVCEKTPIVLSIQVQTGQLPMLMHYSIDGNAASSPISLTSFQTTKSILLPVGVHQIKIDSLRDLTNLGCSGNVSAIPTLSVQVKATPRLDSLVASPSELCFGQSTVVTLWTNNPDSLSVKFTSPDSSWVQLFKQTGQFALNNLTKYTTITTSELAYTTPPNCSVNESKSVDITVYPLPTAQIISPDRSICENDIFPIRLNLTGYDLITGTLSSTEGKTFSFSGKAGVDSAMVTATVNTTFSFPPNTIKDSHGCTNTGTGTLNVITYPLPIISFDAVPDQGCTPLTTKLINYTDTIFLGGGCKWTVGSGKFTFTNCDSTPEFILKGSGSYDVSLKVTTANNCTDILVKQDFLKAYPVPVARFDYNPNPVYVSNTMVQFMNQSINDSIHTWFFGNLDTSYVKHPQFLFPPEPDQEFLVKLVVSSALGCDDSTWQTIKIKGELLVNVPNTFTPNGDGNNDVFAPTIYGIDPEAEYELQIFDRWGTLIFSSNDYNRGWNGTVENYPAPVGVYAYRLKANSRYSIEIKELFGHVNLIR